MRIICHEIVGCGDFLLHLHECIFALVQQPYIWKGAINKQQKSYVNIHKVSLKSTLKGHVKRTLELHPIGFWSTGTLGLGP